MGLRFNSLLSAALLVTATASTSVSAADLLAANAGKACSCVLPNASGTIGSVTAASGDVFKSGAIGFRKASVGSKLTASTEVSTGDNGTAGISYGSDCSLSLGPNEVVSVGSQAGGLCVGIAASTVGGTGTGLGAAAITLGAIGIGAGVAIANGGSNGGGAPASP
ncbi:MAG: hypothetical protein AAGI12_08755 [Pseudomonadota bacterium]